VVLEVQTHLDAGTVPTLALNTTRGLGRGMRVREAEEMYRAMRSSGVLEKAVLIYAQMNEPPGARFRVGHAALTVAEYFRD